MDIADEIQFELEAIAESKCGPIWEGIKNADLLGRALIEIERLRAAIAETRPLVLGANHSATRYPKARAALGEKE